MQYYDSIYNCTMRVFDSVSKTNDLSLLVIDKKASIKTSDLESAWNKIYDELISTFGLSQKFQDYLNLMVQACELYKQGYVDNFRDKITLAELKEAQAHEILGEPSKKGFLSMVTPLSKFMGFRINPNDITVFEFFDYKQNAEKWQK